MTTGSGAVVVIGSVNADHILRLPRLPRPGETVAGGTLTTREGGKGANQAVAAARFGARVRFIGAVGDDAAGRAAVQALGGEGIDVDDVSAIAGSRTGFAAVFVDPDGENQIAVASGANHRVGAGQVDTALAARPLQAADTVLLSFELLDAPIVAAARLARRVGATVVVNPAPSRPLCPALAELSPILTPNRREALALAGASPEKPADRAATDEAARRLSAGLRAPVVVTLGAEGVLAVAGGRVLRQPAPDVDVRDTTGAGDAFSGVLAAGLVSGASFTDAVRLATAAASLSTTGTGPRAALANRDQILAAADRLPT